MKCDEPLLNLAIGLLIPGREGFNEWHYPNPRVSILVVAKEVCTEIFSAAATVDLMLAPRLLEALVSMQMRLKEYSLCACILHI